MKKITNVKSRAVALAPRKRSLGRHMMPLMAAALLTAGFAFSGQAHADILANYDFSTGYASSDSNADTSASAVTVGSGLSAPNGVVRVTQYGGGSLLAKASVVSGSALTPGTFQSAALDQDYFTFTLSGVNKLISVDKISFDTLTTRNSPAPTNYTGNYVVRSSVDGFTTDLASRLSDPSKVSSASLPFTPLEQALSISDVNPITFRIYLYDNYDSAISTATSTGLRIDNIKVEGSVVTTPEPETWAMMGLGMLALAFIGWRRKKTTDEGSMPSGLAA